MPRLRARDGPGRAADEEPAAARAVPLHQRRPAGSTTPATTRGRCSWPWTSPATTSCAGSRPRSATRGELMGIGAQLLHRGGRRRPAQAHGHPRPGHGRRRRAAGAPDRQGRAADLGADPGPGPRDHVRPDRRRGARHPAGRHRGRARRHRPDAVRAGHLRVAGRRRCPGPRPRWSPARSGTRPGWSPRPCSRCRPDDLEWEKGRWFVRGDPDQGRDDRRDRAGRALRPASCRTGSRATWTPSCVYNPPNLTYPFGAYICVVDVDPGTGAGQGAAVHRGRRLRHPDQPDDHRGPGARRPGRRRRHGADGDDRLRRRTATASAARSWTT